jgi:hypothetical protein
MRGRTKTVAGFGWSFAEDAEEAGIQAAKQAAASVGTPGLAIALTTDAYEADGLLKGLNEALPGVPVFGGTSSRGIATSEGFKPSDGGVVGVLALSSSEWRFAVGGAEIRHDAVEAGHQAAERARLDGRLPNLYLMTVSPGHEEDVLTGIAEIAPSVPVIGGSVAYDSSPGRANAFSDLVAYRSGVALAGIYSLTQIGWAVGSGYHPTGLRARVTAADGRLIHELDGRQAGRVYTEWTELSQGAIEGSRLSAASVLNPLGHMDPCSGRYVIKHPVESLPDGSLVVGAKSQVGDEVVLMQATVDDLIAEVGTVVRAAMARAGLRKGQVSAVYLVCCARRLRCLEGRQDEIVGQVEEAAGRVPFLAHFSFGQQASLPSQKNVHGNLMISALVLGG